MGKTKVKGKAKGLKGYFFRGYYLPDGDYIPPVFKTVDGIEYIIQHEDLTVTIEDNDATLYEVDGELYIDHSPATLGIEDEV